MKFLKKATPLKQHGSGIREVIIAAIANARTDDSGNKAIQRVAAAWNAFYQGRELSRIKCHDDSEIVILGTPKAGKDNARAA